MKYWLITCRRISSNCLVNGECEPVFATVECVNRWRWRTQHRSIDGDSRGQLDWLNTNVSRRNETPLSQMYVNVWRPVLVSRGKDNCHHACWSLNSGSIKQGIRDQKGQWILFSLRWEDSIYRAWGSFMSGARSGVWAELSTVRPCLEMLTHSSSEKRRSHSSFSVHRDSNRQWPVCIYRSIKHRKCDQDEEDGVVSLIPPSAAA